MDAESKIQNHFEIFNLLLFGNFRRVWKIEIPKCFFCGAIFEGRGKGNRCIFFWQILPLLNRCNDYCWRPAPFFLSSPFLVFLLSPSLFFLLSPFPYLPLISFPLLPFFASPLLSLAPPFFLASPSILFHGPFALVNRWSYGIEDRLKNTLDLRCMVWLDRTSSSDQHRFWRVRLSCSRLGWVKFRWETRLSWI